MRTFNQDVALAIIDKLIIGALILLAGFFLNRLLEKFRGTQALRKEYETLRDQTALRYLERQIEELYSPLLGLIQYAGVVFRVARQKVPEGPQNPEQVAVWCYFAEKYFLPLNSQMATLLGPNSLYSTLRSYLQAFNTFWITRLSLSVSTRCGGTRASAPTKFQGTDGRLSLRATCARPLISCVVAIMNTAPV